MCIQLKRFDYDWESNRSLKYDDYFAFPRTLNASPYTYDSINNTNNNNNNTSSNDAAHQSAQADAMDVEMADSSGLVAAVDSSSSEAAPAASSNSNNNMTTGGGAGAGGGDNEFELVGVVVHSGQANAGHYYSFVKSHADHKWYKFNDTHVEQVALDNDDTLLADECFGGTFTSPASSTYSSMEERVRYWNGYLLFYRATNADATVNLLFNSDDEDDHADADADADDGEKPTEAPLNQGKLNSRNTKRGGSYFKSYFKKALIRFHTKIDFFPHKLILPD